MTASPSSRTADRTARSPLYRIARCAVICAGMALILAQFLLAQSSARAKKLTGPRAVGLIEITPSGKVSLLPVVIMIDGEFYDASAYKAAPVPFALYTDTVYEGVKTGVSQGLFTVTSAQKGETIWRGQGKWQSAAEIASAEAKKKAAAAKAEKAKTIQDNSDGPPVLKRRGDESQAPAASTPTTTSGDTDETDGRPVLRRPSTSPSQPPAASAPAATPAASAPASGTPVPSTPTPTTVTQTGTPASASPAPAPQTPPPTVASSTPSVAPTEASPSHKDDPSIPTLRRGKPAPEKDEPYSNTVVASAKPSGTAASSGTSKSGNPMVSGEGVSTASSGMQYFPAISDAAGPEPRPYAYSMKPEEEAKFRDKMLALAAVEVRARAKDLGLGTAGAATTASASRPSHASSSTPAATHSHRAAKPPDTSFSDVQLRVFDLTNNNEPIMVLTANAMLPQAAKAATTAAVQYVVTLVAREDIYGDLHKAFSSVTDTQHLDVLPRLELIDAVDAEGDGRGELLFREISDAGKAFVLYRVIGDQLWPLFEGKPQ